MLNKQKISELSATAKRVLPSNGEAWLFGSQARGTSNEASDWDILILLDKERISLDDYDNFVYPFLEIGWNIDAAVSPIIYTKDNWERMSFTPFYKNVTKDKIRL